MLGSYSVSDTTHRRRLFLLVSLQTWAAQRTSTELDSRENPGKVMLLHSDSWGRMMPDLHQLIGNLTANETLADKYTRIILVISAIGTWYYPPSNVQKYERMFWRTLRGGYASRHACSLDARHGADDLWSVLQDIVWLWDHILWPLRSSGGLKSIYMGRRNNQSRRTGLRSRQYLLTH